MIRETNRMAGKFQFATPAEVRAKIEVWQERIATVQPLIERLRDLRNGLIAHLDSDVVLDPKEMARAVAVSFDEIDQIIEVARETVVDSLGAYNNATYVDSLLPPRDFETLFRILTDSLPAKGKLQNIGRPVTHGDIARRAYQVYEERGRIDGNDLADWLRAERELRRTA